MDFDMFLGNKTTGNVEFRNRKTDNSKTKHFVITGLLISGPYLLLQLLMLPISINQILKDRKTERKSSTFSKFFALIVMFTFVTSVIHFTVLLGALITGSVITDKIMLFSIFATVAVYDVFPVNTSVCQLLVALLAIHRLLTFFHSTFFSWYKFPRVVIIIIVYFLVGFELYKVQNAREIFIVNDLAMPENIFRDEIHFLLITFPVLITTVPYTTILLTMGESSRIKSRLQFRSERFVANMIKMTFFSKLLSLISLQLGQWTVKSRIMVLLVIDLDAKLFPLLAQLAYILSNRTIVHLSIDWIKRKWVNRVRTGITV